MWECFALPVEWCQDKRLSWATKAFLSKIYFLTKKGTITKRVSNSFFLDLGFSIWEIRKAWKVLSECGFIEKTIDKKAGNVSYVKLLKVPEPFKCEKSSSSENLTSLVSNSQKAIENNLQHTIVNKEYTENNTINNLCDNSQSSQSQSNQNKNIELDNKKDEDEDKLSGLMLSKKTFQEAISICTDLASKIIQENSKDDPSLLNLNPKEEATRFVSHFSANEWKAKNAKSKLKNVKLAIRNWLYNSLSFRSRYSNFNKISFSNNSTFQPTAQRGKFSE